jgi:hypothetical protein
MELVIFWILCGVVAAVIGANKGAGTAGFIIGFLLGPFGILIMIFSKGDRRSCPYCKEWIHKDATVCPHCQSAIERMYDVRCPGCGERGQVRESLLTDKIECPRCKKAFSTAGARA